MKVGAVIMAGGKSRRMGRNKAFLQIGGETFLSRLQSRLEGFDELLLATSAPDDYRRSGLRVIEDLYPDRGPVCGLYTALTACGCDYLLALSCDMPLFERGLGEFLLSYLAPGYDAFVAVSRDGRAHPLCAVYAKSAADILAAQLEAGNLRMMDALNRMRIKQVPLRHSAYPDEMVSNINTPREYAALRRRVEGPPVVAVCGVKNSGKTTLLAGVIPLLAGAGLSVAVIKHDGHDFTPDVPGTDSYRLREAGARAVAVYSSARYALTAARENPSLETLTAHFRDANLVLVEGGKHTAYPKIEVVRGAVSENTAGNPEGLLAVCTDLKRPFGAAPVIALNDYGAVAGLILRHIGHSEA